MASSGTIRYEENVWNTNGEPYFVLAAIVIDEKNIAFFKKINISKGKILFHIE